MKNDVVHQPISHIPIAIENSKWHQFIARTMYYCQVLRYMNHLRWQARFNKFCLSTAFNFLLFSQFFKTLCNIQKIL